MNRNSLISVYMFVLMFVAPFFGGGALYGQDDPPIKVETVLLNIPVFVSDKSGNPVKGLTKDDFELSVNGKKQEIEFFDDKGAVNIAIVIDANSNTSEVIDRIRRDAQRFIDSLGPEDRAMVIRLDVGGYKVISDLTNDRRKLRRAVGGIDSGIERSRLMDAVLHQIIYYELAGVEGKRAVVVFGDPDSATLWHILEAEPGHFYPDYLIEADVPIYPIFYQTYSFPQELAGKTLTLDQLMKVPPVRNFYYYATLTGGRFYAAGASNFRSAFRQIVDDIRNQYVLGIYIEDDAGRKSSDLLIKTSRQDLVVRAKQKVRAGNSKERKRYIEYYMVARRP